MPLILEHAPSIHMIFGISTHIQLGMWQNINEQLEDLKLDEKKISRYVRKKLLEASQTNLTTYNPIHYIKKSCTHCKKYKDRGQLFQTRFS